MYDDAMRVCCLLANMFFHNYYSVYCIFFISKSFFYEPFHISLQTITVIDTVFTDCTIFINIIFGEFEMDIFTLFVIFFNSFKLYITCFCHLHTTFLYFNQRSCEVGPLLRVVHVFVKRATFLHPAPVSSIRFQSTHPRRERQE